MRKMSVESLYRNYLHQVQDKIVHVVMLSFVFPTSGQQVQALTGIKTFFKPKEGPPVLDDLIH